PAAPSTRARPDRIDRSTPADRDGFPASAAPPKGKPSHPRRLVRPEAGMILLEPFDYGYMTNAVLVSALVGAVCAFLSCYLLVKGGPRVPAAPSQPVGPGVALASLAGLPFALGAFAAGGMAAGAMLFLSERSGLKADVVIGLIFTSFFGLGLFLAS